MSKSAVKKKKAVKEKITEGTPVKITLGKSHPHKKMQLGRHTVTYEPTVFYLNDKELKELESKGCQHWFKSEK